MSSSPRSWLLHPVAYGALAALLYSVLVDRLPGASEGVTALVQAVFFAVLFVSFTIASWWYLKPRRTAALTLKQALQAEPRGAGAREAGPDGAAGSQSDDQPATDGENAVEETADNEPKPDFREHHELQETWKRFREARQQNGVVGHPHAGTTERSPISPSDFFTKKAILGVHGSKLPTALPGIFAAIGLLGTFVGIVMGLAGIDLAAPSDERLDAIDQLMAGMSTAFLTSIAGITQSIWWRIAFRRADHALEMARDGFLGRALQKFPVEQPHDTLARIAHSVAPLQRTVARIADNGAERHEALKEILSRVDSQKAVADGMEATLSSIAHSVAPLQRTVARIAYNGAERHEALKEMLSRISDQKAVADGMEATLARIAYNGAERHEALKEILSRIDGQKAVADGMDATLSRIALSVAPLQRAVARIANNDAVLSRMDKTADGIKSAIQQMGQDLSGALDTHVAQPLRQLNTEFGERQQQALREMVESFQDTLVTSVGDKLNDLGEALGSATEHQVKAARELGNFFDRLDQVADTQTRLLQRTSQVAEVFESGLDRLVAAKEAIAEAGALAQRTMEAAQELSLECQRQLRAQERASEAAARSWSEQVEATQHLHRELRRLTTDLAAKVEEFRLVSADNLAAVFQSFDSEMARVTDHLSGTMNELREHAGMLVGAVRPLPDAVTGLRDTTGELTSTTDELARAGSAHAESLTAGIREFKDVQAEMVAGMEQSLAEVRDAFGQLPALVAAIQAGQEGLASVSDGIRSRLESMSATMQASGERTVAEIAKAFDSAGDASDRVKESAEAVVSGLGALEARAGAGKEALTDASSTARDLIQVMERTVAEMKEALGQLRPLTEAMSTGHEAIRRTYDGFTSASNEIAARIESASVRTVESGERTAAEMTKVLDSAGDASKRIVAAAEAVVTGLGTLGIRTIDNSAALNSVTRSATDATERFEVAAGALGGGLGTLGADTTAGSEALAEASRTARDLIRGIQDMRDELANLSNVDTSWQDVVREEATKLAQVAEGVSQRIDGLAALVGELSDRMEQGRTTAPDPPRTGESPGRSDLAGQEETALAPGPVSRTRDPVDVESDSVSPETVALDSEKTSAPRPSTNVVPDPTLAPVGGASTDGHSTGRQGPARAVTTDHDGHEPETKPDGTAPELPKAPKPTSASPTTVPGDREGAEPRKQEGTDRSGGSDRKPRSKRGWWPWGGRRK